MFLAKNPPSQKLIGTVVALSCLTTACGGSQQQATGPKAIPVKLQTLAAGTLVDSSEFVGSLEARQRVSLSPSRTNGRIVRILVKQGELVRRGQKIVEIQPQQQQENVRTASGNLQVAQANFDKTQADLRTAEAQRDEAKGAVANQQAQVAASQANFANAQEVQRKNEADYSRTRANLNLARVNYKRSKFLVENGVQPQQDLDNKITALRDAESQTQAALKTVEASKATVESNRASVFAAIAAFKQSQDSFKAAEQRVQAARATVNAQKGTITAAQGELGSTAQQLEYNFIVAPIDGVVGDFNQKKIGDNVNVGEEITTITNNQVLDLNLNIPIEYQSRLRTGLPVEVVNPDRTSGVRGQVTFISQLVNQDAQAILVKFSFRNDGRLKDKQYVRVRVIWEQKPGVLVPTAAVTSLGGQKFVFVAQRGLSKEGKEALIAKQIPVEVGSIQGQAYQVLSGIKAGDRIAVSRILDLKDKTAIQEE